MLCKRHITPAFEMRRGGGGRGGLLNHVPPSMKNIFKLFFKIIYFVKKNHINLNNFLKKHHKLVGSKRSHFLCPGLTNGSLSLSLSHDHFFSSAALKMMQKHHNF